MKRSNEDVPDSAPSKQQRFDNIEYQSTNIYGTGYFVHTVSSVNDIDLTSNAISENASNGTIVGITANAFDLVNSDTSIIYNLTDDAVGRFQIDSSSGVVSVKDSNLISYRESFTHEIIVEAIGNDGVSKYKSFNINILDHFSEGDADGLYYVYDNTILPNLIYQLPTDTSINEDGKFTNYQYFEIL